MTAHPVKANLRNIAILLSTVMFLYLTVLPAISLWQQGSAAQPALNNDSDEMTFAGKVQLACVQSIVSCVFFALGAAVGSFVNVVIYRMPRGLPLWMSRSRCPSCDTAIRGRDNIPIFGWLMLGGRCRACANPISSRYPLVEAAIAVVFGTLFFVELISGGANIPLRTINHYNGVVWILLYAKWDLIRLYCFHCFFLTVLFVWVMLSRDRSRIPPRSVTVAFLSIVACSWFWPDLQRIPVWVTGPLQRSTLTPLESLTVSFVGAAIGLCAGFSLSPVLRGTVDRRELTPLVYCLMMLGFALGWQSVLSNLLLLSFIRTAVALTPVLRRHELVNSLWMQLFFTAFAHHILWRLLMEFASPYWPGVNSSLTQFLTAYGVTLVLFRVSEHLMLSVKDRERPLSEYFEQ